MRLVAMLACVVALVPAAACDDHGDGDADSDTDSDSDSDVDSDTDVDADTDADADADEGDADGDGDSGCATQAECGEGRVCRADCQDPASCDIFTSTGRCADTTPCTYVLDYGWLSMTPCEDVGTLCTRATECDGVCVSDCQPSRGSSCDPASSPAHCGAYAYCLYVRDADGNVVRDGPGCPSMSCPFLFLWDGERYEYATDLAGSVLGQGIELFRPALYQGGVYELGDFAADDGAYRLKVRETIHEADYFDSAELIVVDVPAGHGVLSTWSFTSQLGRVSPEDLVTIAAPRPPISAVADDGADVLFEVSSPDEIPLPVRPWELSRVVVDFGPIEHPEHARLVVTGWSHYEDLAALQAPPFSAGTTIETLDESGAWVVRVVAGKNAGDSRTWAIDVSGLLASGSTVMRITMAHQPIGLDVLDAVLLDDSAPVELRVTRVAPRVAELRQAGAARHSYSSLTERIHAEDTHEPLIPTAAMYGDFTRYGDVLPLLLATDDRFVVMAHGDELALEFDEPAPPGEGWVRWVLLDADVFYSIKFSVDGLLTSSIEPMPFHGMPAYPYDAADWIYAGDAGYEAYLETWNTRRVEP